MLKLLRNKMFNGNLLQAVKQCASNYCTSAELEKTVPRDINEIRVMGRVMGNLIQKGTNSVFSVVTHFKTRNENGIELENQSCHNILIVGPDLKKRAEEIVEKGATVIVYGQINYWTVLDENGAKSRSAVITADKILAVEKLISTRTE